MDYQKCLDVVGINIKTMSTLKIENISIGYSDKPILENISLTAASGEFIALIGKNGSGKSTLLKTISGILKLQKGNIWFNDKQLNKLQVKELPKYVSVVLTDVDMQPLSVWETVSLGRQRFTNFLDTLAKEDQEIVENALIQFQLSDLKHRKINTLSDGEKQKVLIARALVQDTPIILLDEPTTHLDLENKVIVLDILKKISEEQNKIVIFSTHDINLVLPKTNKIWLNNLNEIKCLKDNIGEILSKIFLNKYLQFDVQCQQFKWV